MSSNKGKIKVSYSGYKKNSKHKNEPVLVIPSNNITMKGVEFPVVGTDNLGNTKFMMPGYDYDFPGDYVVETPIYQEGGDIDMSPAREITPQQYYQFLTDKNGKIKSWGVGYGHENSEKIGQDNQKIYNIYRGANFGDGVYKIDGKATTFNADMFEGTLNSPQGDYNVVTLTPEQLQEEGYKTYLDATTDKRWGSPDDIQKQINKGLNKVMKKYYAEGGSIHINPAHKGDFTRKANAAGMSVQAFASKVLSAPEGKYDPSTRKQANFAKNASKWKKQNSGGVDPLDAWNKWVSENPPGSENNKEGITAKEWMINNGFNNFFDDPALEGSMKARMAYLEHFGNNPAIQRMISGTDQAYDFGDGQTGTHYMASMDNYAVPQIQEGADGKLYLADYGPTSNEAIKFNSPEEAEYFAEKYKNVAPAMKKQKGGNIPSYAIGGNNPPADPPKENNFVEVYEGSPEWNNYQAQQAKINAYNKWKSEHEGVISQGSTAYGTFAKNPLSGEAAPQGYAGFMRYKTPTDKRVPDNKWNWSAETIDKNTSYNYAPYMEEPKNLIDYKVIDSPEEADRKLREKYLADQNIIGYKRVRNYNAVSGEDNYEYTPVRQGEEIDTTNFVSPDKVPNVVPSFQMGGPTDFQQGIFDVDAINLNAPFVDQPGYYDYSSEFIDNNMFEDAQRAKPFATYQYNPYEEGTKEYDKQNRQNIKSVNRAFKDSRKHYKQIARGNAQPIPVFQTGGSNPYAPYENQRFTEGVNDYSGPGPKSFSVDDYSAEKFYESYKPNPSNVNTEQRQTQGTYGIQSYEVPMPNAEDLNPANTANLDRHMYNQMQSVDLASEDYVNQMRAEGKSDEEIYNTLSEQGYMQDGGNVIKQLLSQNFKRKDFSVEPNYKPQEENRDYAKVKSSNFTEFLKNNVVNNELNNMYNQFKELKKSSSFMQTGGGVGVGGQGIPREVYQSNAAKLGQLFKSGKITREQYDREFANLGDLYVGKGDWQNFNNDKYQKYLDAGANNLYNNNSLDNQKNIQYPRVEILPDPLAPQPLDYGDPTGIPVFEDEPLTKMQHKRATNVSMDEPLTKMKHKSVDYVPGNVYPGDMEISQPTQQTKKDNSWKWKVGATGALSGLSFINAQLEARDNARRQAELDRQHMFADNVFVTQPTMSGDRGDYEINTGLFRPDQKTPVYNRGYKKYQQGGEYDLTQEEIDYILANGGTIEYLD